MAVNNPTLTNKSSSNDNSVFKVAYAAMANGDTGSAIELEQFTERTVQVAGTFGVGGSVQLEGSNDGGTTWAVLRDPQGNNLTFTAAGLKKVQEVPLLTRPNVTAGDGTTALNVTLALIRRQPQRL